MTTTAWAHLPNATHIDRILADLKLYPHKWDAVQDAVQDAAWGTARYAVQDAAWGTARYAAWGAVQDAVRGAAWDAVQDAVQDAAWGTARYAAWGTVQDAVRGAARGTVQDAAWGAIAALVVWDDCAGLLDCTSEEVEGMARMGSHAAVLLLPAVIVFNN